MAKAACNDCSKNGDGHNSECNACIDREWNRVRRNARAAQRRREIDSVYRAVGLTKCRDSSGRVIWE